MSDPVENDAPTGLRFNAFSVTGLLALITGVLPFAVRVENSGDHSHRGGGAAGRNLDCEVSGVLPVTVVTER